MEWRLAMGLSQSSRLHLFVIRSYTNIADAATLKILRTTGSACSPTDVPFCVRVGFSLDKVALGQVCLRVLQLALVRIISPVLHTQFHAFTIDAIQS